MARLTATIVSTTHLEGEVEAGWGLVQEHSSFLKPVVKNARQSRQSNSEQIQINVTQAFWTYVTYMYIRKSH